MSIVAAIIAALLMGIPQIVQVAGKVLDRTGKPLVKAQVVYISEDTGRTFKFKTDKKGEFRGTGLLPGIYTIEITGADGTSVYRTRRRLADPNDSNYKDGVTNFLNADLSMISVTDMPGGVEANVMPGKDKPGDTLTAAQKEAIRAHNANVEAMNDLIRKLHAALEAQQWPQAADILKQLIADDPNRWEFYQNLATVESNQSQYEDAARNYEQGIKVAQSGVTTGSQPDKKDISVMMIYAGDAYARLGKTEKAIELYSQAATISPEPATAYFNICRAYKTVGNIDTATEACNRAISIDPKRWEFYQVLASIEQNAGQDQLAIETYEKGVQAARNLMAENPNATPAKNAVGQMLSMEGNAYLSMKKTDQAIDAFNRAAEFDVYPARDYFNICAALYNTSKMDAAAGACDKAITADPKMADAYYVKASALYGKSKLEHGKLMAPPGVQDALNKYLELDPQGHHAADAREMLSKIGSDVETTFKPRSK